MRIKHTAVNQMNLSEWTEFYETMAQAGWNDDEIRHTYNHSDAQFRIRLMNAAIDDGERDLTASIEDYQ